MLLQDYINLKLRKGTIHNIHYKRVVSSVRKAFKGRVEKETIGNFRIGVDYSNLAENKDKVTGSLPYGMWEYSNEIIKSVTKDGIESYQLRLTVTHNEKVRPQVKWYLDGVEVTKDYLIQVGAMADDSGKAKSDLLVFNVKLDDIIAIR